MKKLITITASIQLQNGKSYLYTNYQRVYKNARWQKVKVVKILKYIGDEGNKAVFETEQGSEILLYKDDLDKYIKEL